MEEITVCGTCNSITEENQTCDVCGCDVVCDDD